MVDWFLLLLSWNGLCCKRAGGVKLYCPFLLPFCLVWTWSAKVPSRCHQILGIRCLSSLRVQKKLFSLSKKNRVVRLISENQPKIETNTHADQYGTWSSRGHTTTTNTNYAPLKIWVGAMLPISAIVIIFQRFRFHRLRSSRETSPKRPHKARAGLCQTYDNSRERLATRILKRSSGKGMSRTRADENLQDIHSPTRGK